VSAEPFEVDELELDYIPMPPVPIMGKGHWVWDETYRCPTHGACAVIDGKCSECGVVAEVVTHV